MKKYHSLALSQVKIDDSFWNGRIDTARNSSICYMWRALNDEITDIPKSGCINNFKIAAGVMEGGHIGYRFQDSDLYKWLEAVAFSLETKPDPELKAKADYTISLIEKAQEPDGYVNSYIKIKGVKRYSDLMNNHELYCAGHMFEAAVAYKRATGDGRFLNVAIRFADHLCRTFGEEDGKLKGYPGHQEIELSLCKLYNVTGNKEYLKLAKFFLDERGKAPNYYELESEQRRQNGETIPSFYREHGPMRYSYQQAHIPVREQTEAIGHAVRCVYMASGMSDIGTEIDETLLAAARTLYDNITRTQMYITGGIGSMDDGEAFSFPYDLPNDRMYSETCAAIGLMILGKSLLSAERNGGYADVIERALYNNVLAGVALDGESFFYVNPLEVWPERSARRHDARDIAPKRKGWYGCACCPPNILRTLLGLGHYIYSKSENELLVNLFVSSSANFEINGTAVSLTQSGRYPHEGKIIFLINCDKPVKFTLGIRIPAWCENASLTLNGGNTELGGITENGYALLTREFSTGDSIELILPMTSRFVHADDRIPYDAGKTAVQRGPLVYCAEEEDNGKALWNLSLDTKIPPTEAYEPEFLGGVVTLGAKGSRDSLRNDALYGYSAPEKTPAEIKLIPYYTWANRSVGEMSVWHRISK